MTKTPTPPKHLKAKTRAWWSKVCADYVLEEHHAMVLTLAAETWDRATQARKRVEKDGIVVKDRFGQLKEHPAVKIERDCKALFSRLLRELALDVDPPTESRPPTVAGRAGLTEK